MRGNTGGFILLIVIVLMVLGVISFGDVVSFVFYVFMGILLLVLIGALILRYRLNRLRREAEKHAADGRTYGRHFHGRQHTASRTRSEQNSEGEVIVEDTDVIHGKVVRGDVGDYVDYEEIEETEEKRE